MRHNLWRKFKLLCCVLSLEHLIRTTYDLMLDNLEYKFYLVFHDRILHSVIYTYETEQWMAFKMKKFLLLIFLAITFFVCFCLNWRIRAMNRIILMLVIILYLLRLMIMNFVKSYFDFNQNFEEFHQQAIMQMNPEIRKTVVER